jgi:hypothetical protein
MRGLQFLIRGRKDAHEKHVLIDLLRGQRRFLDLRSFSLGPENVKKLSYLVMDVWVDQRLLLGAFDDLRCRLGDHTGAAPKGRSLSHARALFNSWGTLGVRSRLRKEVVSDENRSLFVDQGSLPRTPLTLGPWG